MMTGGLAGTKKPLENDRIAKAFQGFSKWQPVGESNPSFQVENLTS